MSLRLTTGYTAELAAIKAETDKIPAEVVKTASIETKIGATTGAPVLAATPTLLGYSRGTYQHVHMPAKCYPSLADPTTFTAGEAKWAEGAAATLIDTGEITVPFDIHYLQIEAANANAIYEISLWSGAEANVEVGRVRALRQSTPAGFQSIPIQIPPQPANTKISVKVATNSAAADTIAFSVFYHEYSL